MTKATRLVALLLSAALLSCASERVPACGTLVQTFVREGLLPPRTDVLFVIDDGPSMVQEQRWLQAQLPAAASMLIYGTSTNGVPDYTESDLHVGVISSDMGAGGDDFVQACSAHGDDGRLRAAPECGVSPGPYEWRFPGARDDATSQHAVACLTQLGSTGCAVSQPLEATLKALLPAVPENRRPPPPVLPITMVFADGTPGHGFGANQGFLGGEDLLIVLITDQDDCSTRDSALYAPAERLDEDDPLRNVELALRCFRADYALRPVRDYVNVLSQLRLPAWGRLRVLIVAGIPPDLLDSSTQRVLQTDHVRANEPRDQAFRRLLGDPRMQVQVREGRMPGEPPLVPSCASENATAYPPRRLVELANGLGPRARLASICDVDLVKLIQEEMYPTSTERALGRSPCRMRRRLRDAEGRVDCRATWELPREADPELPLTPTRCEDRPELLQRPGKGFASRSAEGRVLCDLRQAPIVPAADGGAMIEGEGWFYYDDEATELGFSSCEPDKGSFAYTNRAQLPAGVRFRLECANETSRAACGSDAGESRHLAFPTAFFPRCDFPIDFRLDEVGFDLRKF